MRILKKTMVLLILLALATPNALAQNYSGEVSYLIVPNFKSKKEIQKTEDSDAETTRAMDFISEIFNKDVDENDVAILLRFNNKESLVEPIESLNNEAITLSFASPIAKAMGVIYTDYSTLSTLMIDESLGERLIVPDSLSRFRWKLTGEKKKVGSYTCLKATGVKFNYEDEGIKEIPVVAWYTPEIPVPTGPAGYGGLPGLILELNIGNWSSYRAHEFTRKNKKIKIKKPTKGKILSRVEFEKLLRESDW